MDAKLKQRLALYVHIPFCETKCPYCDFNTYAGIQSLIPSYMEALHGEIRLWGRLLGRPEVSTIFFGGGTPSYVPSESIRSLCDASAGAMDLQPDAEVTIEANPGDFHNRDLDEYLAAGVNRLSIGVQSFDDALLESIGRRHSAQQAAEAVHAATNAGFDNISIDLMFGLPGQTIGQWRSSLGRALELAPEHLSLYGLTIEPGTPLEAAVRAGRIETPDPDLAADMYLEAQAALDDAGYRHYEISNWALPGRESRHNLAYWRNEPYLGVGPGAHSSLMGYRFANLRSPRTYVRRLAAAGHEQTVQQSTGRRNGTAMIGVIEEARALGAVEVVEETTRQLLLADTMMMGLRLDTGIAAADFQARFGRTLPEVFGELIDDMSAVGLLETDTTGIRLTDEGRLLGNEVFSRFVEAARIAPP